MKYDRMVNGARRTVHVSTFALVVCAVIAEIVSADDGTTPVGLERWAFVIGEWNLVEKRYGFDGALIQTNTGQVRFLHVMNGQRIQELQILPRGDEETTALHLFVYDPRSEEIEIARTDSGHYGFWVIIGTMTDDRLDLVEKHPNPESDVTRRITYRRIDSAHFSRQLEFSTNKGESWFVRSEWNYTRK